MRTKLALATLLSVALIAPAAMPCGAPFGAGINVDPRQDIIIVHKDGVETYVFQPRFCGSAREFGLMLPVPGKLAAQPSLGKKAAFTALVDLSQPKVVYNTVCNGRNTGGAAGGTGSSKAAPDAGSTTVVSSGTVGFMDYAQLEATSVEALTAWLDANGYPYDSLAKAAFDYYVKKGWYFVAFRIKQGAVDAGVVCNDLGPIVLTFPSAAAVVPTRMATARERDTSGPVSYSPSFSWRIFGITAASEQLSVASAGTAMSTANFSGLIPAGTLAELDGLAVQGDRAVKVTLGFNYGSTDPDVTLAKVDAKDYREVVYQTTYVTCTDAGPDLAPIIDAGPGWIEDAGPVQADTGPLKADAKPVQVADAGPVQVADAGAGDAAPPSHDDPHVNTASSGCSFIGAPTSRSFGVLVLAALALGLRRRRR